MHEFIERLIKINPPFFIFLFLIYGVPPIYFKGDRNNLIRSRIRRSSKEFRREDIINLEIREDLQIIMESR